MSQQTRDQFIEKIRRVFRTEPLPETIVYDMSYADTRMLDKVLRGKRWTDLNEDELLIFKDDLSLLSDEGFRYYFPAFLAVALNDPDKTDILIDNIIFVLGKTFGNVSSVESFNSEERSLVREFLASYLELYDEPYWYHDEQDRALLDKALGKWS